jgi:hypothetical protein
MRLEGEAFSLRCTTDHPLYDPVAKAWAPAGDWALGQRSALLLVADEHAARVVHVERRLVADGVEEVIDLTVEHELHNFIAGDVLVHNKSIRLTCELDGGVVGSGDVCTLPDGGEGNTTCDFNVDGGKNAGTCTP